MPTTTRPAFGAAAAARAAADGNCRGNSSVSASTCTSAAASEVLANCQLVPQQAAPEQRDNASSAAASAGNVAAGTSLSAQHSHYLQQPQQQQQPPLPLLQLHKQRTAPQEGVVVLKVGASRLATQVRQVVLAQHKQHEKSAACERVVLLRTKQGQVVWSTASILQNEYHHLLNGFLRRWCLHLLDMTPSLAATCRPSSLPTS